MGLEKSSESNTPTTMISQCSLSAATLNSRNPKHGAITSNEPLIAGFALLRAVQLLNFDIYYIGSSWGEQEEKSDDERSANRQVTDLEAAQHSGVDEQSNSTGVSLSYRTILDDLEELNPLKKYIDRSHFICSLCRLLKIALSLMAIMIGFDKTISTIILCLLTTNENLGPNSQATTNTRMGLFVLVMVNLSSMYILFSIIFNGHLLWNLLNQRLFLVSKSYQYRTMLYLLSFVYLDYIINITFINNLYEWDFISNDIESGSYSVVANLRIFVTEQDVEHYYVDIFLTILQFARGVIHMSPYITISYAIICLKKHIYTIRNQHLLTKSLKRRQKLRRLEAASRRVRSNQQQQQQEQQNLNRPKRVIFSEADEMTEAMMIKREVLGTIESNGFRTISSISNESAQANSKFRDSQAERVENQPHHEEPYLSKISDFDQLESYITNLYIFTGRLNRIMSQQGISVFFVVHNLVISVSIIVPETIHGGPVMVYLIRGLLIMTLLAPFVYGQQLEEQLDQLSKQIDRIIILQQFSHHRRDNLVRIRELVHDVRVNCGGMLDFNVETGIKYLVVAFASAFFIEQEHYKLTRRH